MLGIRAMIQGRLRAIHAIRLKTAEMIWEKRGVLAQEIATTGSSQTRSIGGVFNR
jgi:hypothetical protein